MTAEETTCHWRARTESRRRRADDALGVATAHVVGASMGGNDRANHGRQARRQDAHPPVDRVDEQRPEAAQGQARRGGHADGDAAAGKRSRGVDPVRHVYRVSPGYPTPEPELRARVECAFDRSYNTVGVGRQMLAILSSGSRGRSIEDDPRADPRAAWRGRSARAGGRGEGHRADDARRHGEDHPRLGPRYSDSAHPDPCRGDRRSLPECGASRGGVIACCSQGPGNRRQRRAEHPQIWRKTPSLADGDQPSA
jgi:hypothetical protein